MRNRSSQTHRGLGARLIVMVSALLLGAGCRTGGSLQDAARTDGAPGADLTKCGVVLSLGEPDAWDGGMVESPVVWYDSLSDRYGMVYTGYDWRDRDRRGYGSVGAPAIGLAWSEDLFEWSRDERSPIFDGSGQPGTPDEGGATGPFMWYEHGLYYLFYFGTTEPGYEGGKTTMNLASSPDLVNWVRHPDNPIIEPAGTGWRRDAIWHPNVVRHDGRYYLFFNASGVHNGLTEEFIGFATSSDLRNWTIDDSLNPVLVGSAEPGAWDASGRAGDPSLYRVGDIWYMAWYSWDLENTQDGLAMTSVEDFPLGWKVYDGNPVLRLGAPDSFDGLHAGKPFVYRTQDRHHHFYTAVDTAETRQIALAVSPGPCP